MDTNKFIKEQIVLLCDDFSNSQIMDNVYRFVFRNYIPNITINAAIFLCMEMYAEIITKYNKLNN